MTRPELLAEAVLSTKLLLGRYLAGFTEVTHTRSVPDLPNHVAWNLGHLSLTMLRVAGMIDQLVAGGDGSAAVALPVECFVKGDGTRGSRDKGVFDSEAVAFGSKPEDRYDRYPSLVRCVEIFNLSCDRLAAAIGAAGEEVMGKSVRWGQADTEVWALCVRMVFHCGFHTGQIADMRRSLAMKSIFA